MINTSYYRSCVDVFFNYHIANNSKLETLANRIIGIKFLEIVGLNSRGIFDFRSLCHYDIKIHDNNFFVSADYEESRSLWLEEVLESIEEFPQNFQQAQLLGKIQAICWIAFIILIPPLAYSFILGMVLVRYGLAYFLKVLSWLNPYTLKSNLRLAQLLTENTPQRKTFEEIERRREALSQKLNTKYSDGNNLNGLPDDLKKEIFKMLDLQGQKSLLIVSKNWHQAAGRINSHEIFKDLIAGFPEQIKKSLESSIKKSAILTQNSVKAFNNGSRYIKLSYGSGLACYPDGWVSECGVHVKLKDFGDKSILIGKDAYKNPFVAVRFISRTPLKARYRQWLHKLYLGKPFHVMEQVLIISKSHSNFEMTTERNWFVKNLSNFRSTFLNFQQVTQSKLDTQLITYLCSLIKGNPCREINSNGVEGPTSYVSGEAVVELY